MKNKLNIILIFILLFMGCQDEPSNPLLNGNKEFEIVIPMNGDTRDITIIQNLNAENMHQNIINHSCTTNSNGGQAEEDDCIGFWCNWNGETCEYENRNILIIANEVEGLYIYEINEETIFNLDEIYSNNIIEFVDTGEEFDLELRKIYYAESHNTLYMLDKFEYIYNLYLPPALSLPNENNCSVPDDILQYMQCGTSTHTTQFAINENNLNTYQNYFAFEMFVLFKHNQSTNSSLDEGEEYSEIRLIYYSTDPNASLCNDGLILSDCTTATPLIEDLDYNVTDIYFDGSSNNNRFFVANPSDIENSINYYFYNPFNQELNFSDKMIFENKVNCTTAFGDYMLTGMKDDGCYIVLLNENGISDDINDKLHIGDNFSVYDIYYDSENDMLLLSCGSNGVLIYSWDGENLDPMLLAHISSSYAYTAKVFNSKIIVGTENGIEVFILGN